MLYEKLFPHGMELYSDKELWEVYDKLGVELHDRGLSKEYWQGKRDEQIENEIDDLRMKEEDLVK